MWLRAVPVGCRSFLNNKEGVKSETHIRILRRHVNGKLRVPSSIFVTFIYMYFYQPYLFLNLLKGGKGFDNFQNIGPSLLKISYGQGYMHGVEMRKRPV